ncbi:DUF4238 domain-containing protein [Sphingopyxis witflariensis]|uniref:DUF4238 domain-containing protein n=1 Tax=Sphingopyxis witflariensis TaxID=173675 RepID=UPI0013032567|nr:DUF4238 domain-containing protein [Sphingopyxis witflariensis]
MSNEPKKHHYVPQFYMRQFVCPTDPKKVMTLERHRNVVVADPKSIEGIGYEDHLHNYEVDGVGASIESDINKAIETPFSRGRTWRKVSSGQSATLDESDRFPIYGFARHLQRRNLATLRFIESQHARYRAGELEDELTDEERDYHAWLAEDPGAAHKMFRAGATDTMLPDDAAAINVMVCQTPIPLRTSTNPTLMISSPGHQSIFGAMFNSLRTWWLTLDQHHGAFIIAGGPSGFSSSTVPPEIAHVINRQYLTQFLHGDARYMLAHDEFIPADLEWAGFVFEKKTTRGFRYRKQPRP